MQMPYFVNMASYYTQMQLKYCNFVWTVQLLYTIYMELAALQTIHDYYHPNEILHTLKWNNTENKNA